MNPAHNLVGQNLPSGWKVIEKLERTREQTGAMFSVCYLVQRSEQVAFLKAFDFTYFFNVAKDRDPNASSIDVLSEMLSAHLYERDISVHCRTRHVDRVALIIDSGVVAIPGFGPIDRVPYLIFDRAKSDVRAFLHYNDQLEYSWRLKSLHDVAVGLSQLHNAGVSHQDLKPSNILVYESTSKIADLGRSKCTQIHSPYNNHPFSGDWSYAPIEAQYGFLDPDWKRRALSADCYLLGSLIGFYFCGSNVNGLLLKHLPSQYHWNSWGESYEDVVVYLVDSFVRVLEDIQMSIQHLSYSTELVNMIEYLCHPDFRKRGEPKTMKMGGQSYNLIRTISKLDLLRTQAESIAWSRSWQQ